MRDLVEGEMRSGEEEEGLQVPGLMVGVTGTIFFQRLGHHRALEGAQVEVFTWGTACGSITEPKGCPAAAEDR